MLPVSTIFKSSLSYFLLVFGAGFICGSIRVPFLEPLLGDRHAQLLEMPIMLLAIWKSSHIIVARLNSPSRNGNGNGKANADSTFFERLVIGLLASAVLLAVEIAVAAARKGWNGFDSWIRDRDPVAGAFYFALIGIFLVLPSFIS